MWLPIVTNFAMRFHLDSRGRDLISRAWAYCSTSLLELEEEGDHDQCFFLGDSVDYGPYRKECIEFLRENMDHVVMGNHDNAMANDEDCGCHANFKIYADETLAWHRTLLGKKDI